MRWPAALVLALAPALALAQQMPALYDVTGVAGDDVLNIRETPSADAVLIGALAPNALGVEVIALSPDTGWGQINAGESAGWVSMRYLARQPGQETGVFPDVAICYGTDPFWSVTFEDDTLVLDLMDGDPLRFGILSRIRASGRTDRFSVIATSDDGAAHAVIARAGCSDDMSDRAYGLSFDMIIETDDGYEHLTGCCRLER